MTKIRAISLGKRTMLKGNGMSRALLSSIPLILCIVAADLNARVLEGEGYGNTVDSAKVAALSALANSIYVDVESKSSVYQDSQGTDDFSFQANLTTNIPIIGVKYHCRQDRGEHFCSALLDERTALPLYQTQIVNHANLINSKHASLPSLGQNAQLDTLYTILAELNQYEKLRLVERFLSGRETNLTAPSVSIEQINATIDDLEDSVGSLEVAAKLIGRRLKYEKIYVAPVTLANSREVTPFSSALTEQLKTKINSVHNRSHANYFLNGRYQQSKSGIRVSYNLSDKDSNTVEAIVVSMLPRSYKDYRTTPLAPDFDQLLHHGYAVSNEFKTSLVTNKGMRNLVFHEGEEVELLMKMNKPGYFYLVGHTKNTESEQSYLIELNDAPGDRRFIGYTNADDVNKWVSLGEFVAEKPFGLESIQLLASTNDLLGALPSYKYVSSSGYYVISHKIEQGVRMTRGLKKVKKSESSSAESVLMFTTENK